MRIVIVVLSLILLSLGKPIYDFKKSYVINLTPLNYGDQVSKYRQNTNYVSVVQFYKHSGTGWTMQMANPCPLSPRWISGPTNTEGFFGSARWTVSSMRHSVKSKELLNTPHSK
jgi:hypothetical protein